MDIGDYYSKSFKGFTNNPKLALPSLLGYILIYGIIIIMALILLLGVLGTDFLTNTTSGTFNPNSIDFSNLIMYVLILYGVIAIVGLIVSSYMSAATIGMSKSIINGEMPDLGVGFENGNKYFLKIIAVTIIIGIIMAVPIFLMVAGLLVDQAYGFFPILTIIGVLVSLIIWICTLLFIFANQSIVVCDKSVIGSLKDSYKTFRENLSDVIVVLVINFIIIICIMGVMFLFNAFLSIIPIVGSILAALVGLIVYSVMFPYFTLVLTCLYMDKKDVMVSDPEYVD
jgi:hypothetical protein